MSQLFASGGQSIGISASASVLPVNECSGLISFRIDWFDLLAPHSRVFSSTTVQKHFGASGKQSFCLPESSCSEQTQLLLHTQMLDHLLLGFPKANAGCDVGFL